MNQTILTIRMKEQFSLFSITTILYALFYTFCLYKNASGITYPFFVTGTLCYFFFSMKRLGVPCKKDSLFYVISIVLLGISNCCTDSPQLLWMNKTGIFLLSFILILHTVYQDTDWNLPKYIGAIFHTIGSALVCLVCPLMDLTSFFDAQKLKKQEKNNTFYYILIGIALSIPLLLLITLLLCSADVVFQNLVKRLFSFDIPFRDIFKVGFSVVVVFFFSYALLSALCKKTVEEGVTDKRTSEPIIGIVITGMLSVLYLVFSMIQILYLFIGNLKLPEGYTYSSYARQGFFQLLAVCLINLILVLFFISRFKDNKILKMILTVISGCTFIMILSSALRMFMYIARYNLTFLRIFVLWALIVIFLLMLGVTIYIYYQKFPLFFYSVAITTVFYIGLSFSHPDYWIAKYNLTPSHISYLDEYDIYDSQRYLTRLSLDAAPVLLDKEENRFLWNKSWNEIKEEDWIYSYYQKVNTKAEQMHIRNFNFSVFFAKRSAGL